MSYCSAHQSDLRDMTMVVAHNQHSGRGQRGNGWESEPGKNLTVTLFHIPEDRDAADPLPVRQFRVSMAAALAVADTLARYGIPAQVKWSNDVYIGDRKASGILIEHTVAGSGIVNSRIGIGLNVNQSVFLSDAPNPVSMSQTTGEEYVLAEVLDALSECLEVRLRQSRNQLYADYIRALWRHDGRPHTFRLREADRREFQAVIKDVRPDGPLILATPDGQLHNFYFKEIEFVL